LERQLAKARDADTKRGDDDAAPAPRSAFSTGLGRLCSLVRAHTNGEEVGAPLAAFLLLLNNMFLFSYPTVRLPVAQGASFLSQQPIKGKLGSEGTFTCAIHDYVYRPKELENVGWYWFLERYHKVKMTAREPMAAAVDDRKNISEAGARDDESVDRENTSDAGASDHEMEDGAHCSESDSHESEPEPEVDEDYLFAPDPSATHDIPEEPMQQEVHGEAGDREMADAAEHSVNRDCECLENEEECSTEGEDMVDEGQTEESDEDVERPTGKERGGKMKFIKPHAQHMTHKIEARKGFYVVSPSMKRLPDLQDVENDVKLQERYGRDAMLMFKPFRTLTDLKSSYQSKRERKREREWWSGEG
jgi:hypothetical protein